MVTASIVTYNHSQRELSSLLYSISESKIEIIFIIDNSKTNHLIQLRQISEKIVYIFNNCNRGFGSAHNIGMREAMKRGSKYHIILNPDVNFEPNIIERLVSLMDTNFDYGLVMPKILYPDGSLQYLCKLLPTPMDWIGRRFLPFKKMIDRRNFWYELRFANHNEVMDIPSLSGCFMFVRLSILGEVGLFDERFFMYAEDTDLCRRIGEVARTIYFPEVSVVHQYEKGSYKHFKLLLYHIKSALKYFNKWGWVFDKKRRSINQKVIDRLK